MTAIAALVDNGKIWMGGDSAGVDCGSMCLVVRKDEKVFIRNNFIMGFTSSFRMGNLLRYSLYLPPQIEGATNIEYMNTSFIDAVRGCFKAGGFTSISEYKESGGTFIVGYRGALYEIEDDFQVAMPADDFISCGCGSSFCMGSLYSTIGWDPETRIKKALESAERFSAGVRGPFVIQSL